MIGIFDSGIGGLTVYRQIKLLIPRYQTIYLADLAHLPYGNKSPQILKKLAKANTKFLLTKGANIIVIACNTASSYAFDFLKKEFALKPIFDVITPTVQKALATTNNNRIGVIGTSGTIRSKTYQRQIKARKRKAQVFSQACPLLVPLIEENWQGKKETANILRFYLQPLQKKQIDTLILGCTHYPLLKKQIREIIGQKVRLIDSARETALTLKKYLTDFEKKQTTSKITQDQFYTTDFSPNINILAAQFLKQKKVNFKRVNILKI